MKLLFHTFQENCCSVMAFSEWTS